MKQQSVLSKLWKTLSKELPALFVQSCTRNRQPVMSNESHITDGQALVTDCEQGLHSIRDLY